MTGVSARLGSCFSKELGRARLPSGGSIPIVICSADGRVRADRRGGMNGGKMELRSSKEDNSTSLNLGSVTKRRVGVNDGGG